MDSLSLIKQRVTACRRLARSAVVARSGHATPDRLADLAAAVDALADAVAVLATEPAGGAGSPAELLGRVDGGSPATCGRNSAVAVKCKFPCEREI